MKKLQGTIISVLNLLDHPVYRTEIVKFVYMIDEMYYRHFGTTITGMEYKWDNFGPNSANDGIVNEAEKLVNEGIIHMSSEPNQYGGTSYLYKLENTKDEYLTMLSDGEKYVIRDVTCHFKNHNLQQLIQASKRTTSFKGVKQYEPIMLKQSEKYQDILRSLHLGAQFKDGVEAVVAEEEMGR